MNVLVEKLREAALCDYSDEMCLFINMEDVKEAANEIERLRGALAEIAAHDDQFSSAGQARAMCERARSALGGESVENGK